MISHAEIGLSFVLAGPFAQRVLQPGVETARVNMEKPTHRPHGLVANLLGGRDYPLTDAIFMFC